jgi:hypothetical protein
MGRPGPDGDISEETSNLQLGNPAPEARYRITKDDDLSPGFAARAGPVGIMADEVEESIVANPVRLDDRVVQPHIHRSRDGVDRAAAERVVRMTAEQRRPRCIEERSPREGTPRPGNHRPRFGFAQQRALGSCVRALLVRPGGEGALQRPGIPVRVAELPANLGKHQSLGCGTDALGEARQ